MRGLFRGVYSGGVTPGGSILEGLFRGLYSGGLFWGVYSVGSIPGALFREVYSGGSIPGGSIRNLFGFDAGFGRALYVFSHNE